MPNLPTPRGTSGVAWPGLVVLLGSICAYWLAQGELTTSRPEPPGSEEFMPVVGPDALGEFSARMWEDPLRTSYEDWDNRRPGPLPDHPVTRFFESGRRRHAMQTNADDVKELFKALVEEYEDGQGETLCLPVLVTGGINPENKETRLRTRYAVVTALTHAGYNLSFAEKMSYAVVTTEVLSLKEGKHWTRETFVVPVKLYRRTEDETHHSHDHSSDSNSESDSGTGKQILVLWINESQLGKLPLLALHRIMDGLFGTVCDEFLPDFRIIGPSSSDGLLKMYEELEWLDHTQIERLEEQKAENLDSRKATGTVNADWEENWRANENGPFLRVKAPITILSPRATAMLPKGAETKSDQSPASNHDHSEGEHSEDDHPERDHPEPDQDNSTETDEQSLPEFRIIRTIGNDHLLFGHAIRPELQARGAWPDASENEVMVVLTEQDTSYGRRIVGEFEDVFSHEAESKRPACEPVVIPLRVLKYFQGTDGLTAGESDRKKPPSDSPTNPGGSMYGLPGDETTTRLPQGESQYDYLRRLIDEIQHLQEEQKVTAIGVVASDVYDKLLILRALRPHFPEAVFFTTDLDAIYTHPDEIRHSRNLIIASHFGLTLGRSFHDSLNPAADSEIGMLPFRDSYQTAEHLTTRIAIDDAGIRASLKRFLKKDDRHDHDHAASSESAIDMALELWDHEHKHEDRVRPLITTVGNHGLRQLPLEISDLSELVPTGPDAFTIQPQPASNFRSRQGPFLGMLALIAIGSFVLWERRDSVKDSLRFNPRTDSGKSRPADSSETLSSENAPQENENGDEEAEVDRCLTGFLRVTLFAGSVFAACWVAVYLQGEFVPHSHEQVNFDGTSVMPRVLLNIVIGLCAACTLVHLARQIVHRRKRWKDPNNPRYRVSVDIAELCSDDSRCAALREFSERRMWKVGSIWLVGMIWWAGILFYAEPFVWSAVGTTLAIGLLTMLMSKPSDGNDDAAAEQSQSRNLSAAARTERDQRPANNRSGTKCDQRGFRKNVDRTKKVLLGGAFGGLLILALEQLFFHRWIPVPYVYGGWSPEFISRGWSSRWLDRCAMLFGYTLLIGLFVVVIYGQQWCRDLTRVLRCLNRSAKDEKGESRADSRVHSLVFLGEATAVTRACMPWLLAYMLVMILAYHPLISPVPVPRGLLVLLSLGIVLLVASTIYLQFMMQAFRQDVLYDLRGELFELRRSRSAESQPSSSISSGQTGSSSSSSAEEPGGRTSSSSADDATKSSRKKTAGKRKTKTKKKGDKS